MDYSNLKSTDLKKILTLKPENLQCDIFCNKEENIDTIAKKTKAINETLLKPFNSKINHSYPSYSYPTKNIRQASFELDLQPNQNLIQTVEVYERLGKGYFYFYRNLTKRAWSVRESGQVRLLISSNINTPYFIVLINPKAHVVPSGRINSLNTKQRNVHAFLKTRAFILVPFPFNETAPNLEQITYYPFEEPGWAFKKDKSPFLEASQLFLTDSFKCFQNVPYFIPGKTKFTIPFKRVRFSDER